MKRNETVWACCLFLALQTTATAQVGPVFKDGEAQVVEAFANPDEWIREDLWVETRFDSDGDGNLDRMHVAVTRPAQTADGTLKLPIVYESSPYYAGTAGNDPALFWDVEHELGEVPAPPAEGNVKRTGKRPIISNSQINTWVPRGYIVVHSSSPGTGLSDGSPTVGGRNESLAPMAVIEWLSGKDNGYTSRTGDEKVTAFWSTGKVGMTGTSYNGTLPLAAATTGVEALKAIIPVAPNTSYYHYYRSNGLVRSPGGYLGEDIDVLFNFIHSGEESKRERNAAVVRDGEMRAQFDRATGDYNDFWAGRDYLNQMDSMKAALLMSHGFNDWNVMPEHSYRIFKRAQEMGIPSQIYYHQGGHGGPPPLSMMNRWFTHYLHGVENGVEQDPIAWIVREGADRSQPTPYENYPNPMAQPVTLFPVLPSVAEHEGCLSLNAQPSPSGLIVDNVQLSAKELATAPQSPMRLLFTTPVLQEDLHLSGTATLEVTLGSSKTAANFSVYLVALPWDESDTRRFYPSNVITRGWADPQNHSSLRESHLLVPGEFYHLTFDLQPDDQVIPAGKQLGLMLFSSDQEFTLHPRPGTVLQVVLEETKLTLPVVGGAVQFETSTSCETAQ